MALVGTPINVGTASTTLLTVPLTFEASLHSLILANSNTSSSLDVTLSYFDSSSSAESTFLTTTVSGGSTFTLPKPVNMNGGDKINASATGTGLVALVSSFQNSSTPIARGFVAAGEYTATTTYSVNDLVSYTDGSSYLSRVDSNQGNTPGTNASAWQTYAAIGNTGPVASITAGTGLSGGTLNAASGTGTFTIDSTVSTVGKSIALSIVFG